MPLTADDFKFQSDDSFHQPTNIVKRDVPSEAYIQNLEAGGYPPKEERERSLMDEIVRDAPAIIGSIVAPLLTSKGGAIGKMFAAALGGVAGKSATIGSEVMRGKDPSTFDVASELGTEALTSGLGEGVGQALGKGIDYLKFNPDPQSLYYRNIFKGEAGGDFSLSQITQKKGVETAEGFLRGFIVSKPVFDSLQVSQMNSLKMMTDDLSKTVSSGTKNLSDEEIGQLFLDTVADGRAAHSSAASALYRELDTLTQPKVTTKTKVTQVPTGLSDASGKPLTRPVTEEVTEMEGAFPVDIIPIKEYVSNELARMEAINNFGASGVLRREYNKLVSLPDNIPFTVAHELRSNLLSSMREIDNVLGKGKMKSTYGQIEGKITAAMNQSVKDAGREDVWKAYRKANDFYRNGKSEFDNKFIANMIVGDKIAAEKIGEHVFKRGNVTEINKTKKALRAASKYNPKLDPDVVWRTMQSKYLEGILSGVSKETSEGPIIDYRRLLSHISDPKTSRTIKAVFDDSQVDRLRHIAMIGSKIDPTGQKSHMILAQMIQASVFMGAMYSVSGENAEMSDYLLPGVAVTVAPTIVAKAFTSPKAIASMVRYLKEPSLSREASTRLISQLSTELARISFEEDGVWE